MSQTVAIALGCVLAGALCVWGAVSQVSRSETRGASGRRRLYRSQRPGYFWYLFAMRIVLGPIALVMGCMALQRMQARNAARTPW
jgi:hypothetical protein